MRSHILHETTRPASQLDQIATLVSRMLSDPKRSRDILDGRCHRHSSLPPKYICGECATLFCRDCASYVSSSNAAICKSCDSLCFPYEQVRSRAILLADQGSRFGLADLKVSAQYPFKEALASFGLGAFYGASMFSLPFFNIAYAGILLGAIGLVPAFLGNSMMFGCSLRIIDQARGGGTDCNEIFDVTSLFSDLWDTVRMGSGILLSLGWLYAVGSLFGLSRATLIEVTAIWTVLTYPAVLAVAAITRGFWSTINPVLVLSMIFRMRGAYWKLFGLYLPVLGATGSGVVWIASSVLPQGVNLPVYLILGILAGPLMFYANMVIACLIGRALFKHPDCF
jgi:hypothetical protein